MQIEQLTIENYKSFRSAVIDLAAGFNVIVGQNNSGKTALLEAFDLDHFISHPHRRLENGKPAILQPYSKVSGVVVLSGAEFKAALFQRGGIFQIPINSREGVAEQVDAFFAQARIEVPFAYEPHRAGWSYMGGAASTTVAIQIADTRDSWSLQGISQAQFPFEPVRVELLRSIFLFRAERLAVGQSGLSDETNLQSRAENLATAILHLQTRRPHRYHKLNNLLGRMFPNIHGISAQTDGGAAKVLVWNIDAKMEYPELAIELAQSGTGVGQAVALLFAMVTADFPRIFIIDEPNSFLHPSAVRSLFNILGEEKHQYIVSTHAAEVISIAQPSTLHLVHWSQGASHLERLCNDQITEVRRALNDVGVRLAEVFGANQIVWVEGDTERLCFPLLAKAVSKEWPTGVAIVAILHTGDFDGKKRDAEMVWKIYERLSSSNALLPPALAFSFDREGRTDQQILDLQRRSKSSVHFLPCKTYENYLIEPSAIIDIIREFSGEVIELQVVEEWLTRHGGDKFYEAASQWDGDFRSESWLRHVHGAKLLKDLFEQVTQTRLYYDKIAHSVRLTEVLLRDRPAHLMQLSEYVIGLLKLD